MTNVSKQEVDAVVRVNEVIDSFLSCSVRDATTISPFYGQLWRDIQRLIGSGGKRVRPTMTVLAYRAFGGDSVEDILPIAAAQELLHLSLLIHDDIIDRDYIRYGVDNIAGAYEKKHYSHVEDTNDRLHYAQSAALLAGDLLISSSYRLMLESNVEPALLLEVQKRHGQSIFEVAGGELIDTESAFRPFGEIDAQTVALYKTASYTFVGPLLVGAILANATEKNLETLELFAKKLGIAYQLRDDVIGVFGDETMIGKTTIGDIREGKHTYMVEQFYDCASEEEKAHFELYFGDKDVQKSEAEVLKNLFISTGALKRTESAIEQYATSASAALESLDLSREFHDQFKALITTVTRRSK